MSNLGSNKFKFFTFILLALLTISLSISTFSLSAKAQSPAEMKNITIQIMVSNDSYDAFVSWITPFSNSYHFTNFTFMIELANYNYDWFLKNATRVNFLTSIGEAIPDISAAYIQQYAPNNETYQGYSRNDILNTTLNDWNATFGTSSHFGVPEGIFMYQPDTYFANQALERGVNFIAGYCFDQYQVDYMSMRGGWQLPYYSNSNNVLVPQNNSNGGMVILPWLTWDWVDSFQLSHLYESECIGSPASNVSDYITKLVEDSSSAGSPFGYATFGFNFNWYYTSGSSGYLAINQSAIVLSNILSNRNYQKYSDGNFTTWFRNNYVSTPTYNVNFASPNSGNSVEWYYSTQARIARVNNTVVSYVDYTQQSNDRYLTGVAVLNFSLPPISGQVDNSLRFTIDDLGGGMYRAPVVNNGIHYSDRLSDFPDYYRLQSSIPSRIMLILSNVVSFLYRHEIVLLILFGVCLALIAAGIVVRKHRAGFIKKTRTRK